MSKPYRPLIPDENIPVISFNDNDMAELMWLVLAQYGVMIDDITDEGEVYFTVPKNSEMKAWANAPILGVDIDLGPQETEMAGELLREFANSFFEQAGLTPHGGVRDETWTQIMGTLSSFAAEQEIQKEGPQLLRV